MTFFWENGGGGGRLSTFSHSGFIFYFSLSLFSLVDLGKQSKSSSSRIRDWLVSPFCYFCHKHIGGGRVS